MTVHISLTAANMGDVPEDDFFSWQDWVATVLPERVSFPVQIDLPFDFANGPARDEIAGGTEEQQAAVREALAQLWEGWCA